MMEPQENLAEKGEPGRAASTGNPELPFTVDAIDFAPLSEEVRARVQNMLRKYEPMWDGTLGEISTTSHHIDLKPGAHQIAQHL